MQCSNSSPFPYIGPDEFNQVNGNGGQGVCAALNVIEQQILLRERERTDHFYGWHYGFLFREFIKFHLRLQQWRNGKMFANFSKPK